MRAGTGRAVAHLLPPEATPEEARRAADEVLADPVFDRPAPGILARLRDWFAEVVQDAFDALVGEGGGVLGWVIVALLLAAATLLAVRFARGVRRDPGAARRDPGEAGRPATDWLAEAQRLEAQGEWRAALRCRYRGLVAGLAARGLVEEVPGRTAGEYRADVARSLPDASPAFDGVTGLFETAWYGGRHVGADDASRLRELSEQVLGTASGVRP